MLQEAFLCAMYATMVS
uniref:Uncharacterized protein n=1 Tax=Arundo donax TaxID=35708 RepID=A0A0A9FPG2_ARUDO